MQQNNVLSTNDVLTWVIKIFGIIGMIFIGISLALPWAGYSLGVAGLNLNLWGSGSFGGLEALTGASFNNVLNDVFYLNAMQSGVTAGLIGGIFYILTFVFVIIALIISIKAFRGIGTGIINKTFLIAGIFGIVTIVMCVIGTSQIDTYARTLSPVAIPGGFGYTWGFILLLIAAIFYFVNYGLDYYMHMYGTSTLQTQGYQQQQQPQVMYTSQQPPPQQPIQQPQAQQQPPVQQPPAQQQPPVQQTPAPVAPVEQPPQPTNTEPPQNKPKPPKFCNSCGAKLQAGVKFCNECGAKI